MSGDNFIMDFHHRPYDQGSQDPILLDAFLQTPHLQVVPYLERMVLKIPQPFNLNYHFLRFSSKDPLYVTVHYLTSLWQIFYIHFQRRQKPVCITIIALTKAMGRIPATILVLAIAKKCAVIISRFLINPDLLKSTHLLYLIMTALHTPVFYFTIILILHKFEYMIIL